jgi:hypothetical protein
VDGDDRVEVLLGHVEQHPLAQDPRDADDAVDAAPGVDRGGDDGLARTHLRDVAGDGDGRTAGAAISATVASATSLLGSSPARPTP